nr:MAG TPA_asm: hypothetical protein [Bacteriophage sp.]
MFLGKNRAGYSAAPPSFCTDPPGHVLFGHKERISTHETVWKPL